MENEFHSRMGEQVPRGGKGAGSAVNAFGNIFLFEIKYRLRRPDTYLYFIFFLLISFLGFSTGNVPAYRAAAVNSPLVMTQYFTVLGFFMMVVTAAIMGAPLYRDIEYSTHEYYLSYPITKNDYFWGRFLGSFFFVLVIASALVWGALMGSWLGPKIGWLPADRLVAYHAMSYIQPFFAFLVPNLLLTSCIFFGLVSFTRNNKVIYTGGVILYLGYMTALFILNNLDNKNDVFYFDAFAITPVSMLERAISPLQKNTAFITMQGLMLTNRIIWTAVGLGILVITYFRFSFSRFFGGSRGKKEKKSRNEVNSGIRRKIPPVFTAFGKGYTRNVMYTLWKIELLSIVRDHYFRLILATGTLFLGFIFWMGFGQRFGVHDLPRTVLFMEIYNHNFIFFIFLIILFYTGEAVHREKLTRFAIINDALPPADWVLYTAKLIALVFVAVILASIPLFAGIIIQVAKGYSNFRMDVYLMSCYVISLPLFIEMIMISFALHVVINNKFAGHAVGLVIWTMMLLGVITGKFDYRLMLYSYTPDYVISELDGFSPSLKPVFWFTVYWLFAGGLFLVLAALFYYRGVISSFRERISLARHRFPGRIISWSLLLLAGLLSTGFYNYYNVSFLNTYLTGKERVERKVAFERQLKKYANNPLPTVIQEQLFSDIFPAERRTSCRALMTLVNKSGQPINTLLLDGDRLSTYEIRYNGKALPYSNPLIYPRAKFSLFSPAFDTSMYRLYQFPDPWMPGDTALMEVLSAKENKGFSNGFQGVDVLQNGTAFDGGLPGMGYDDDEELKDWQKRKEFHLPERPEEFPAQNDSAGQTHLLYTDGPAGLMRFEATVTTAADQVVVAPGRLIKKWTEKGRAYYHFIQENPGYPAYPVVSATYALRKDNIVLDNGKSVDVEIYYLPRQGNNVNRFMDGYKDGLIYFSKTYGPYQFDQFRTVETPLYTGDMASFSNLQTFSENYGWNASFNKPGLFDYCYFYSAFQLGHQWWMYQVAPNHTLGANNIAEGLSKYGAYLLYEKKFGIDRMDDFLSGENRWYTMFHRFAYEKENPLMNSKRDWVWGTKAAIILFGLKDLIGEDNLNSALREFRDVWCFRNAAPYAGSNDLYRIIKKHTPDSLQYYLTDSWEKITQYNNKLITATAIPTGKNDEYKVHIRLFTGKSYADSSGNDIPARSLNDLIDIGITSGARNRGAKPANRLLFIKKYRFSAGEHQMDIIVRGNPGSVVIDPRRLLLDNNPDDNEKRVDATRND
ncbi:MAG: hypothetical protein ABIY90_06415 [Puia sp.]